MNKREYLSALEAQLKRLPSDDVKEIVKEFDAHFDIASSEERLRKRPLRSWVLRKKLRSIISETVSRISMSILQARLYRRRSRSFR